MPASWMMWSKFGRSDCAGNPVKVVGGRICRHLSETCAPESGDCPISIQTEPEETSIYPPRSRVFLNYAPWLAKRLFSEL